MVKQVLWSGHERCGPVPYTAPPAVGGKLPITEVTLHSGANIFVPMAPGRKTKKPFCEL